MQPQAMQPAATMPDDNPFEKYVPKAATPAPTAAPTTAPVNDLDNPFEKYVPKPTPQPAITGDHALTDALRAQAKVCGVGTDCSAFTQNLYKKFGVNIPRTAVQQYAATAGNRVLREGQRDFQNLKPGDIVFFDTVQSQRTPERSIGNGKYITHVGVYLGDGKMLHDPGNHGDPTEVDLANYSKKFKFMGASRPGYKAPEVQGPPNPTTVDTRKLPPAQQLAHLASTTDPWKPQDASDPALKAGYPADFDYQVKRIANLMRSKGKPAGTWTSPDPLTGAPVNHEAINTDARTFLYYMGGSVDQIPAWAANKVYYAVKTGDQKAWRDIKNVNSRMRSAEQSGMWTSQHPDVFASLPFTEAGLINALASNQRSVPVVVDGAPNGGQLSVKAALDKVREIGYLPELLKHFKAPPTPQRAEMRGQGPYGPAFSDDQKLRFKTQPVDVDHQKALQQIQTNSARYGWMNQPGIGELASRTYNAVGNILPEGFSNIIGAGQEGLTKALGYGDALQNPEYQDTLAKAKSAGANIAAMATYLASGLASHAVAAGGEATAARGMIPGISKAGADKFGQFLGHYFITAPAAIAGVQSVEQGSTAPLQKAAQGMYDSVAFWEPGLSWSERLTRGTMAALTAIGGYHSITNAWETGSKAFAARKFAKESGLTYRDAYKTLDFWDKNKAVAGEQPQGQPEVASTLQESSRAAVVPPFGEPHSETATITTPPSVAVQEPIVPETGQEVAKTTISESPPVTQTTEPPQPHEATGLANQVQGRETAAGVLADVEATKGKSPEEWQQVGKQLVDDGADFEVLADRIRDGHEELTGEKVGILLEGKRQLVNEVNKAKSALDEAPQDGDRQKRYAQAQQRLDDFATSVQAGKGRWSDVGRALQAGTTLNEGNFAEVLQEAKRGGNVSPRAEKQLAELSQNVAERDARIAQLEKDLATAQVAPNTRRIKQSARKFDRGTIHAEIDDLLKQFAETSSGKGVGGNKQRGAVSPPSGEDVAALAERTKIIGQLAISYAKLGAASIEDVVLAVQKTVKEKLGIDLDRQEIIDAWTGSGKPKVTRTEAEKELLALRRQAKSESTEGKAKVQARIDELKKQLDAGEFHELSPREIEISQELQNLRDERDIYAGRVRSMISAHRQAGWRRAASAVGTLIRGSRLGGDAGALTRQGLFVWGDPIVGAKATARGAQAMFSEGKMARWKREYETAKAPDGKLMMAVEKKAGLSITDQLNHEEEIAVGRLFRRVPGLGHLVGGLERLQSTFLNTARRELFAKAVRAGYSTQELADRAHFINSATGRGNWKGVPQELGALMTSPRYEMSRWEMLWAPIRNIATLRRGGKLNRAAVQNLWDMSKTAAEVYSLYKAAELAGYKTNFDPNDSDFLKLRRGDEVWDVSAGLAPRLRDIIKLYSASTDPHYKSSIGEVLQHTIGRTFNPAITLGVNEASFASQRSSGIKEEEIINPFTGLRAEADDKNFWILAPLILQSVKQAVEEDGWLGGVSAGAKEFAGGGVNRYKEGSPPKEKHHY